jgi:hypothetical protein
MVGFTIVVVVNLNGLGDYGLKQNEDARVGFMVELKR